MREKLGSQFYSDAALVGQTLGGDYLIEERVGQGGMAWVYRATHRRLGGAVAVKVLFSHFLDDTSLRTRFLREARSQYTLNHPHIVRVLDFIEESGVVGFVSEWCDAGELLRWWRPEAGLLSLARLQALLFPILDAMGYAHQEGVIHRDLKPHNILVQRRGDEVVPKVTDFGIAKFAQQKGLTRPGMMVGTLQYMAPEQVEGRRDADLRSDIYSLGVIMYQMIAGDLPFVGESMSLVMKVLEHAPPPLPPLHVPNLLAHVVMRCLAKNPDDRYNTCAEVKQALQEAIEQCGPTLTLTDAWQRRVAAVHSLDPEGDISLVAPSPVAASGPAVAAQALAPGEAASSPALEQTNPGAPPALAESRLPSGEGSLTRTFPPRSHADKDTAPQATPDAPALASTSALPVSFDASEGQTVPAKSSVLRQVPVALAAEFGGGGEHMSGPTKRDPGGNGWGGRLALALLLLACGGAAGSYLVMQRDVVLAWLSLGGERPHNLVADGGLVGRVPDKRVLTPRVRPVQADAGPAQPARVLPEARVERRAPDTGAVEGASKRRACREGDAAACYWLGRFFARRAALPNAAAASGAQARHWLQKACDVRHPQACFLLGRLYHAGRGGPRVDVKARMYFRQACGQGAHRACLALGRLFQSGFGGPYDAAQAIAFYTIACKGKVASGCRLAGVVWMTGRGHPRHCARANALLQRACRMGDRDACPLRCQDTGPQ